jgi:hypothetical protein
MTDRFNLISQQLLQKDFSDCSIEELQLLAQQYPYFAPAQFLLVRKLKEENSPQYAEQFQKATLYHHNPLSLDLIINYQDYETNFPTEQISTPVEAPASTLEEVSEEGRASSLAVVPDDVKDDVKNEASENEQIPVIETGGFDIMDVAAVESPKPQKSPDLKLSFEPYHTVDYFASLGIKLSQEEVGKDQFGRQLKSFTEWLKTMKKLPASEQIKTLDPHAEEKVENIAAHSLDNAEVLTEAMAEVWVKQGKLEKAIEVYNKLSLLNPSKRAYFAAKLENLKKAI